MPPNTTDSNRETVNRLRTKNCEDFNQKKCVAWFKKYSRGSNVELMGPEGVETLCEDLGVETESVSLLVLAWKMGAQHMGYFSLQEWLRGLSALQCDSLSKLKGELGYLHSLMLTSCTFDSIYLYAFDFCRDKDQKGLDRDTAKVMLRLLLGKKWTLLKSFLLFLDQSRYRVLDKDHWCDVLEFSRAVNTDLKNCDSDVTFPVVLREFVEWLKKEREKTKSRDKYCLSLFDLRTGFLTSICQCWFYLVKLFRRV